MDPKKIKIWTWASRVLQLLGLVAGVLAAADKLPVVVRDYAAIVVALLGVAVGWINGFLPPKKAGGATVAVGMLIMASLLMFAGCTNAYRAGWVSTASLIDARDAADKGVETAFRARVKKCAETHGGQQMAVQECVYSSTEYRIARKWVTSVYPAINTAVKTAKSILEIAEKVNASKESVLKKVLSALKDAACAAFDLIDGWRGHDGFPDGLKTALDYLSLVKVVCK